MNIHCSKLARPMVCAGFMSFEGLQEPEPGDPAKEGTAAGEYLERRLLGQDIPKQARNGVYFDDDMRFYVNPVWENIRGLARGEVRCETQIDWRTRSGVWIKGKYDASFTCGDGNLYIDDLKYGWGLVEAPKNWQLLGYAIGEVIRRQQAFKKIILRIHQPRPHHEDGSTRAWEITYEELLDYKEQIEARMDQITAGFRELQTGSQCKYCPAAGESCPAFNRLFYRALEVSTEFTQDQIDESELARQLDHVSRASEVLKIKQESLNNLATQRIAGGKVIPGYITEKRWGDRTWKPDVSPRAVEMLTGRKITEEVMLSPAKAEKLGIHKEFIASLVDRRFVGQKLVKKDAGAMANKIFGSNKPAMGGE